MWFWTCPKDPKFFRVNHSFKALDKFLTMHENGSQIPELPEIPPCEEEHNYWDDGEKCHNQGCGIRYIPGEELVD